MTGAGPRTASSPRGSAVVAVVGAKGAPGATTSVLALALAWPRPVLVIDADPAGGDIAAGWLAGRVSLERGLLSFAAASRHAATATPADLAPHVVTVPDAPGVLVLPGLAHGGQAGGLDAHLWTRLLDAATSPWPAPNSDTESRSGADPGVASGAAEGTDISGLGAGSPPVRVDVLADCGRINTETPWPLLAAASMLLLATRPTLRGVHHARHTLTSVQTAIPGRLGDPDRVGLLLCGAGPYDPDEVGQAVGLPAPLMLPADSRTADTLTDQTDPRNRYAVRSRRTPLARAARTAALRLSAAIDDQPPGGAPQPGTGRADTGAGVRR